MKLCVVSDRCPYPNFPTEWLLSGVHAKTLPWAMITCRRLLARGRFEVVGYYRLSLHHEHGAITMTYSVDRIKISR